METTVRRAGEADLDAIARLFDGYRQFYGQASDPIGARAFLYGRLMARDSVLFIAIADDAPVGFTQLYPSFTSTGMRRIFILNDLFVTPAARGSGAGRALLRAAAAFARGEGAARLSLSTARDNTTAQRLYEAEGYVRDEVFFHYELKL